MSDGRFYRAILSPKLEPSLTAEIIADKIGQFYRSCVIEKLADFCRPIKVHGKIVRLTLALVL